MRVIFLGSAYFGYVYAYMFDAEGYSYADLQTQPAQAVPPATSTPATASGSAGTLIDRLTAWLSRGKQEATC
jgi:hypothetical protein